MECTCYKGSVCEVHGQGNHERDIQNITTLGSEYQKRVKEEEELLADILLGQEKILESEHALTELFNKQKSESNPFFAVAELKERIKELEVFKYSWVEQAATIETKYADLVMRQKQYTEEDMIAFAGMCIVSSQVEGGDFKVWLEEYNKGKNR